MAKQDKASKKDAIKHQLMDKWEALDSKTKKKVVIGGIFGAIVVSVLIASPSKKQETVYKEDIVEKRASIVLEPEFTEVDLISKVESQISSLRSELSDQRAKNDALEAKIDEVGSREATTIIMGEDDARKSHTTAEAGDTIFPEPPPPIKQNTPLYEQKDDPNLAQVLLTPGKGTSPNEPRFIGSIMHVQASTPPKPDAKKNEQVYLPPSHMPAVLMTGLKAHTIKGASKNPSQVLLRVQKPAVLPNHIKAQLSGCFVIAEGYGRLDTQRIELRTVSISCLSKEGKSLIDQEIDGFIADADGSVGLAGHVYSHMDKSIGYAFAAGAFSGFGEHYALSNSTVQTSGLGTVTTYDPSDSLKNGMAQGIGDSSDELKDIYLDIVKQAAPVIEVGPTKEVTIIISKGTYLKIKELES